MSRRFAALIFLLAIFNLANCGLLENAQLDSIDQKINSLLSKMTLEEKLGQMTQFNNEENNLPELARQGKVGSVLNIIGAARINEIQKAAVENSRLGIPVIVGMDVIHGFRTIFPICLGEAATWDPALVEKSARIAAKEATAVGIKWTFAPMVDIARDARWGRIAEGSGEDVYLGSQMAAARVRGFQGKDLTAPTSLVACAKHFAAYGAAIAGMDYNTVDISQQTLLDIYLPPFKAAKEAGVGTFMCAFNDLNGIPCSANEYLLTKILRDQWHFKGFVVSDWNSIDELLNHGIAANRQEAGKLALTAGVDMDMIANIYQNELPVLVRSGQISEALVDQAVRRILRIKFAAGLFENSYIDPEREKTDLLSSEHLTFARELAAKSLVLLKNEKNLLPLSAKIKSIAVLGPAADDRNAPQGWWNCDGKAEDVVTVLNGIQAQVGSSVKVKFAKGCDFLTPNTDGFSEAVKFARESELVILVVGEDRDMSGEGASRAEIGLPGRQLELVQAVVATQKPVVVVLMNGRPLAIPWLAENVPAILVAWQPGTQCGHAVADVLFGGVNPGGKLPVSFPISVGQEPLFYNYKATGRPTSDNRFTARYFDLPSRPLFPFGFGLSYTQFNYQNLKLSSNKIAHDGSLLVSASIQNTGKVAGDEVVQLYIRDVVASLTRPVKELKGFKRISLKPGEAKTIEFNLGAAELGFHNAAGEFVVEPGQFKIWIGPNSAEGLEGSFEVVN